MSLINTVSSTDTFEQWRQTFNTVVDTVNHGFTVKNADAQHFIASAGQIIFAMEKYSPFPFVFVDGIFQTNGVHYQVEEDYEFGGSIGTNPAIRFFYPISQGQKVYIISGAPAYGCTQVSQIITESKPIGSTTQTITTFNKIDATRIIIFKNGLQITNGTNYTIGDSYTINFTSPLVSGDVVNILIFDNLTVSESLSILDTPIIQAKPGITANTVIAPDYNAFSVSPYIHTGVEVLVSPGSVWSII